MLVQDVLASPGEDMCLGYLASNLAVVASEAYCYVGTYVHTQIYIYIYVHTYMCICIHIYIYRDIYI